MGRKTALDGYHNACRHYPSSSFLFASAFHNSRQLVPFLLLGPVESTGVSSNSYRDKFVQHIGSNQVRQQLFPASQMLSPSLEFL